MRKAKRSRPEPGHPPGGDFTPPGQESRDHATTSADATAATTPPVSGGRISPRNWRVRTRLNAILLVPVAVALVVGGLNIRNSVDQWRQADTALRVATLVRAAATYSNDLLNERDVSVVPLLRGETDNAQVAAARNASDQAERAFDDAAAGLPDTRDLRRPLATYDQAHAQLAQLRRYAYTAKLPGVRTEEAYAAIQRPLMDFTGDLDYSTGHLNSYGRDLHAIELAKAAESLVRSTGEHVLAEGNVPASVRRSQLTALTSYQYLHEAAIQEFQSSGTPGDIALLRQAEADARQRGSVTSPSLAAMVNAISSGTPSGALRAQGVTPDAFFASATATSDAYRGVVQSLADQTVSDAASLVSGAKISVAVNSAGVLAGVLLAFLVASLMARSMGRGMRALRTSAFEVAEQRLPALVDQLTRTDPGRVDTRVAPIPINTVDEIGEVARAFDHVHREAVRLAAEQALLRGNVNAIFTSLSQRNQGLIQRQLALITELENNEADPDQLENLFRLDHLATRMRRNGENLLILAGEEPGRQWNQPVPLVDVLRAAASEVESYERIEISGVPETDIHGMAVTDLVHLLAELLENATSFSSPPTRVRVTATRMPDGRVMVEIQDSGIGLTAADFADINRKLANPPVVDAAVSQGMGLYVVGRLAARHGVRVQLRPSGQDTGTVSLVTLPETITHGGGGEEPRAGDVAVSVSPIAHEVPDDAGELDPISRSLKREERRAALERRQPGDEAPAPEPTPLPEPGPLPQPEPYAPEPEPEAEPAPYQEYPRFDSPHSLGSPGSPDPFGQPGQPGSYGPYTERYQPDYAPQYPVQGYGQPYQAEYPGVTNYDDHPDFRIAIPQQPSYEAATTGAHEIPWDQGYARASEEPWRAPATGPERGGFDAPDAGVVGVVGGSEPSPAPGEAPEHGGEASGTPTTGVGDAHEQRGEADAGWRSANDEHWLRAEQVRTPKAGGVTLSGLPLRVPRANLVPGAAQQTAQGGPQVSRAPEDVRGRLSNLRRGVQQGRGAGADATSIPTDTEGLGPNHQER